MLKQTYTDLLSKIKTYSFIIIDERICRLYPDISEILSSKKTFILTAPEAQKNIEEYSKIISFFLSKNITRSSTILAIGGGATSDLAGFVAATILRGIKWDIITTTLLGRIDASLGGKVGINTPVGKNLIGAFHSASNIYYCADFIDTLPVIELDSGKGEFLKYAFLDTGIAGQLKREGLTDELFSLCSEFKLNIVRSDFKESGNRKFLNLGHTFGHAIEKCLSIPHGIAVYHGIYLILRLFSPNLLKEFNVFSEAIFQNDLKSITKMDFNTFDKFLRQDKKMINSTEIELILVQDVGELSIAVFAIDDLLKQLRENEVYEDYFQ